MSTHIVGFVPPDDKYNAMKSAWDSCKKAGVDIPERVLDFFNHTTPSEHGAEVDIDFKEWNEDMREGIEIDLSTLPSNVKVIRFYNSW